MSPLCVMHRGLFYSSLFPFSFLFFPQITPILCSAAYFSVNFSHRAKISRFLFGGSKYSSYFCRRLKDDSKLSGRATVSPMASQPQAFFMPEEYHFAGISKKVYRYGGCMNRKIWLVLSDKSSSFNQRGMQPPPFSHEIKLAANG